MRVLHQCSNYLVRYNHVSSADVVVVTFAPWTVQPTLDANFFGEAFFRGRGINAIGIRPARNDWYQGSSMNQVIETIRRATQGMRLVGYGGSMGAYAVINFADDLGLDSLVAIGPQFSIDPAKVPFETRWNKEAQEITFRHDKIERGTRNRRGWILYDPHTSDTRHADLILAHHDFTPVQVYFADHHPLAVLQQTGLTEPLLLDLVHDRLDRGRFVRLLRHRRRSSEWIWMHVSKALQARGNIAAALRAIEAAKAISDADRYPLDVQHAGLLLLVGGITEAVAMIQPYTDHPIHGDSARWLLQEWQVHFGKSAGQPPQ